MAGGVGVAGMGMAGGGWIGVGVAGGSPPHTCTCMHMHAHTCTHGKHDNFMQMATPMGNTWEFPMMSYVHVYACVHVHMGGMHPLTTPNHHSPTPQPPGGGHPESVKI